MSWVQQLAGSSRARSEKTPIPVRSRLWLGFGAVEIEIQIEIEIGVRDSKKTPPCRTSDDFKFKIAIRRRPAIIIQVGRSRFPTTFLGLDPLSIS
jgi:hypothetical protein